MLSRGRTKVRKFPAPLGAAGGRVLRLQERGLTLWLTQHLVTACKQWLKLRRGFHIQVGCWECCSSHYKGCAGRGGHVKKHRGRKTAIKGVLRTHPFVGCPLHRVIPSMQLRGWMEQEQTSPSWLLCLSQTRVKKKMLKTTQSRLVSIITVQDLCKK